MIQVKYEIKKKEKKTQKQGWFFFSRNFARSHFKLCVQLSDAADAAYYDILVREKLDCKNQPCYFENWYFVVGFCFYKMTRNHIENNAIPLENEK